MKQIGLPPWDLAASALIAVLALALSIFQSENSASSLTSALFIIVLLLPGYLLSIALFPKRYDLTEMGRLVISTGADALLALILSIGLGLSSWGLSLSHLAASAAISSLIMAVAAHFIRSAQPKWNRFVPLVSDSRRGSSRRREGWRISRQTIAAIVVLAAAAMLVAFAYSAITEYNANNFDNNVYNTNKLHVNSYDPKDAAAANNIDSSGEDGEAHFTEFYLPGKKDADHPIDVAAGAAVAVTAGIINHENKAVNYSLVLAQSGSILLHKEIRLDNGQSWEGPLDCVLTDPGNRQRLDVLLYKDRDFSQPYSEDHLWFNVLGEDREAENSAEGSENSTSAAKKAEKVVVLGVDEDKSKNKKRIYNKVPVADSGEESDENTDSSLEKDLEAKEGSNPDSPEVLKQVASSTPEAPKGDVGALAEQFSVKELESDLYESSGSVDDKPSTVNTPNSGNTESDVKEIGAPESRMNPAVAPAVLEVDDLESEELKADKIDKTNPNIEETDGQNLNEHASDNVQEAGFVPSTPNSAYASIESKHESETAENTQKEIHKIEASEVEPAETGTADTKATEIETSKDLAKVSTKLEMPELKIPKVEPPKVEPPKVKPPKVEPPKVTPPKVNPPKIEIPKVEIQKIESPKVELEKEETPNKISTKSDTTTAGTTKADTTKTNTDKIDSSETVTSKPEGSKEEKSNAETPDKVDSSVDSSKIDKSEKDKSEISDSAGPLGEGSSPDASGEARKDAGKDDAETKNDAQKDTSSEAENGDSSSGQGDSDVSQKKKAEKESDMDKEINSWVGTRGFKKSGQGQSFASKNIHYVKNGADSESAVLGSQSKTSVKLGK